MVRLMYLLYPKQKLMNPFPHVNLKLTDFLPLLDWIEIRKGRYYHLYQIRLPCKILKCQLPNDVEGLFLELNLRKYKWELFAGYNPKKECIFNFMENIGSSLDKFIETINNLLLIGNFNSEVEEEDMKECCETYNLVNLIKVPTCFKSVQNPTSIDVILTNKNNSSYNSCSIETGLSDHHKMTITVLKPYYTKLKPSLISYRSYKNFDEISFKAELGQSLHGNSIENMKYDEFKDTFMNVLNKYAPMKEKTIRGNNAPFMNKSLPKAYMGISRLKNKYNESHADGNHLNYNNNKIIV